MVKYDPKLHFDDKILQFFTNRWQSYVILKMYCVERTGRLVESCFEMKGFESSSDFFLLDFSFHSRKRKNGTKYINLRLILWFIHHLNRNLYHGKIQMYLGNSIGFYYTLCKYCTVYIHTSLCKNCPHLRCKDKNYHVFQKISEITIRRDFT